MSARKVEPVPVAPSQFPPHVFAPDRFGTVDPLSRQLVDCLVVDDHGRRCPYPRQNAVHRTSSELVEALPPKSPDDRSNDMIGDRESPDPPSRES